ncbi:MAG: steroid Delta-isomerase [Mycobacterium sp.]|jgi:steroid delta-isomerase|nr:steroid Delta-isomerase [Mycobacterium sp.]
MTSSTSLEIEPASVVAYFAALRENDPHAWAAALAVDAEGHDPAGTPPLIGREAFVGFLTAFIPRWGRFDGLREDEVFVSGDAVAVRWTGGGASALGTSVTFSGINIFFLDADGLISKFYSVFDLASIVAKLGS